MPRGRYITRPVSSGFSLLHGQHYGEVKQGIIGCGWVCATSVIRPVCPWRSTLVRKRCFSSKKDDGWYDWYARLHADPKSSVKDLRKAFFKRAKVEHPDHDKTPGAKARFQNASNKPPSPAQLPFLLTGHRSSCKTLLKICVMNQSGRNMINRGWPDKRPLQLQPTG